MVFSNVGAYGLDRDSRGFIDMPRGSVMFLTISLLLGWAVTLAWGVANSSLAARWRDRAQHYRAEADALHAISKEIESERDKLLEVAHELSTHVIECHKYVRALGGTTEQ